LWAVRSLENRLELVVDYFVGGTIEPIVHILLFARRLFEWRIHEAALVAAQADTEAAPGATVVTVEYCCAAFIAQFASVKHGPLPVYL